MPVECKCIECGNIFLAKSYKKDTAKFCSKECMYKNKKGKPRGIWILKICPSCGTEFETLESKEKKYCSSKCLHERNEMYEYCNCHACNKKMRVKKSYFQKYLDGEQKSITCSRECASKLRENNIEVHCDNCGKILHRTEYRINKNKNQFCSNKCQKEFIHKNSFEIRKCEICNKEFECSKTSSQRFCSNKCNSKWQETIVGIDNPKYERLKKECDYCKEIVFVPKHKLKIQEHFFVMKHVGVTGILKFLVNQKNGEKKEKLMPLKY